MPISFPTDMPDSSQPPPSMPPVGQSPFPYATRPELERIVSDVEALKTANTEIRLMMNEQAREQARQSQMLERIQTLLDEERHERDHRDDARQRERVRRYNAIRRTIWIANTIGPALLTMFWHFATLKH